MSLSRQVLDRHRRCVNLRDQRGGLTTTVLRSLRNFLLHNNQYIHLYVSDNPLEGETIAELCALIRDHSYLTTLEVQCCGLSDKYFRFYFGPAIATMARLTSLDLSRNLGLTDSSAEMVARILIETEVETVRLLGTSFTEKGGRVIAKAAVNSPTLLFCELPFTVGKSVLEDIETFTSRNRAYRAMLDNAMKQYRCLQVRRTQLPLLPSLKHPEGVTVDKTDAPPPLKPLPLTSLPSLAPGVAHSVAENKADRQLRAFFSQGRRCAVNEGESVRQAQFLTTEAPSESHSAPLSLSSPLPSLMRGDQATKGAPDEVTLWDLVDPVISSTLNCLDLLYRQAQFPKHRSNAGMTVRDVHQRTRMNL
ncbi:hypothetical protein JKF63_03058 [Porcisia hertigi]|uniref:Uncharacterized protein n=1 Tax=Porcisia hertigi TaxID=2761500 RepID=A0A836L8C9_9TRYP|nr:hypothetical protein JKF63_03058 [Porcisia hertigi]